MTDLARIGFAADTSGLTKAQRELGSLANKGEQTERKLDKSIKNTNQSFMSLKSSVGMVGTALAALGSARLTQDLVRYSDSWKGINSQIRQVTQSEKELLAVRQMVVNTAKETRSDLEATTKLYAALDRSTTHLGVSTEKQIELTKTINNLFLSGGKSAEEASGAIRQLTQGLESGALRGDEFNSVAENAPRILDALASSLGMARGELREFAATGGITAEILVKALSDYNDEAQKLADQTEVTFGQNMEIATTNLTAFVGELDTVNSVIGSVGNGIAELTGELGGFANDLASWSGQFSAIGDDLNSTMSSTSDTFRLEMIAMGAIANETLKFLTDAVKHFPSNLRAIGQIISTELISAVDIAMAAGKAIVSAIGVQLGLMVDIAKIRVKAFGNVLGTELALIVKKAEIYGKQIKDAINPFDGDTFDHEAALKNAERLAQEMNNAYLKQADEQVKIFQDAANATNNANFESANQQIETSRAVRLSMIMDTLAIRGESIKTFEDLLNAADKSLGAIPEISNKAVKSVTKLTEKTDEWKDITERAADRIDKTFADVWLNITDGFESVADGLIDGFKRMLAEMAHAAITKPIVMQITGAMGMGGAGGMMGGMGGALGGLLGFGGMVGGSAAGGALGGLGQLAGGLTSLSSFGMLGGAFGAGVGGTTALLGAGSLTGALANTGALFSSGSIMAGIGSLMPMIAGVAAIAGIADKLTGGGLFGTSYKTTGQSLTLGTSGGDVSGYTSLTEKKKRSLFRGTKTRVTNTDFDTSAIEDLFSNLELSIIEAAEKLEITEVSKTIGSRFADVLGNEFGTNMITALTSTVTMPVEEWLDNFSSVLKIDTKDLNEEEIQAKINEWVEKTTESMVDGVFGDFLSQVQKEGESSADALNRAIMNMDAMALIADTIGVSFELTGQEAAIAATNISELAGGLQSLTGLTTQYYNSFFSEQEKFDKLASDLGVTFDELGQPMPQTRDAFRALVESLDLTTEEGQQTFSTLMQLVPGMDAYLTELEKQVDAVALLEDSLSAAYDEISKAIGAEKLLAAARMESSVAAAQAEIDALNLRRDALDSQRQLLDDNLSFAESQLRASFGAEKQIIQESATSRINALNQEKAIISSSMANMVNLANKMNQAAGNSITVQQALDAARRGNFNLAQQLSVSKITDKGFSSAEEMAFAQARQNAQLREIGGLAGSKASAQERLLSSIDKQIASTEKNAASQIEALDAQLMSLLGIDTSVLSLDEAIKLYQQAQLDLDELNYTEQITKIDEQLALSEAQIELAQQTYSDEIERLDAILEDSEAQINALLGIDTSVMSVEQAVNNLHDLIGSSIGQQNSGNQDPQRPPPKDMHYPHGVDHPIYGDENRDDEVAEAIKASTRANAETADILQKIYRGEINVRVMNP